MIKRIAVAFEAGRDGFWLARWPRARGIEVHVIHASSVAVSREHGAPRPTGSTPSCSNAPSGWLRGERDHCKMVAIPTIKDEDGKRPNRERESLVGEQSRIINRIKAQHWSGSASAASIPSRRRLPNDLKACARPRASRSRPANTLSELHRDMERRRLVRDQVRQIESARRDRLEHAPGEGAHHDRLFVNVKTATSPMQQLHLILLGCAVGVGLP